MKYPLTFVTVGTCPSDSTWKYVRPYCYYFSDVLGEENRKGWFDAEAWCNTQGGNLVSIASGTENALIMEMVRLSP